MIPRRKPKVRMGVREPSVIRCPGHLQWTRGNACAVANHIGHLCSGKIHAHHVQSWRAIEGGMGMKVGDDRVIALCASAHDAIHRDGQTAFEKRYDLSCEAIAKKNWQASPHRLKYEAKQKELAR